MELSGQTAMVTGASLGIGRAIAIALADAGANVGINFHSHADAAEEVAAAVRRAGRQAILLPGDVADYAAVEAMVQTMAQRFGRLDIAVSNAAYSDREAFHEANLDGFRRTIDVTMWGAYHLLRAAVRQMLAQAMSREGGGEGRSPGTVVIISSPHAFIPVPRSMPYNMAKAAIDQMARTAAIELAPHRIRINMVHPGWIDTPGERKFASDEQIEKAGAKLPWGRLGTAQEVARGVVFLCDPRNDYMTGSALLIDGGITLPWWANRGSAVPE